MHPIALAMQGMALWHLLLGVAALAFTLTLVATDTPVDEDTYVVSGLTAAEITGGALAGALILGGISWVMLGRAFWRPRWSVILLAGLTGTLVSGLFELVDWPASYLIGGFAAYWVIRTRLDQLSPADSSNS
jgi:hypothetical protein